MLGADYAGYFALGDAAQLAALLRRCASDADFLALLQRQCQARTHLFEPQEEQRLVINLIKTALNPLTALPSIRHSREGGNPAPLKPLMFKTALDSRPRGNDDATDC
jgi:hypothetical protein